MQILLKIYRPVSNRERVENAEFFVSLITCFQYSNANQARIRQIVLGYVYIANI